MADNGLKKAKLGNERYVLLLLFLTALCLMAIYLCWCVTVDALVLFFFVFMCPFIFLFFLSSFFRKKLLLFISEQLPLPVSDSRIPTYFP